MKEENKINLKIDEIVHERLDVIEVEIKTKALQDVNKFLKESTERSRKLNIVIFSGAILWIFAGLVSLIIALINHCK